MDSRSAPAPQQPAPACPRCLPCLQPPAAFLEGRRPPAPAISRPPLQGTHAPDLGPPVSWPLLNFQEPLRAYFSLPCAPPLRTQSRALGSLAGGRRKRLKEKPIQGSRTPPGLIWSCTEGRRWVQAGGRPDSGAGTEPGPLPSMHACISRRRGAAAEDGCTGFRPTRSFLRGQGVQS